MDFMKVFDQTVREIKREVNLKVLKVPEIEQKVLDATDDEPWGPHGTVLAEIAQATKKFSECQMVMNVLWTRLTETGKNWRFVYKALAIIEYLVAHGSERAVDDIIEHTFQISSLASFEYVEPSGKDLGINVRKKAETIVTLLNSKEKIQETRNKAAANRDKYFGLSSSGVTYKAGSASFTSSSSSFRSGDQYGDFSGEKDADGLRSNSKDRDLFGDDKHDQDVSAKSRRDPASNPRKSSKTKSSHSNRSQATKSVAASKKSMKIDESDNYASVLSQNPSTTAGDYEDNFDDFDPRGTFSAKPSAESSNEVDLFGQNFIGDLLDAPTSVSVENSTSKSDLPEVDLFADATFVSATSQDGRSAGLQTKVDLFASRTAPLSTASTMNFFDTPDNAKQSVQTTAKSEQSTYNLVDPFAAIPLNNFGNSDPFGDFAQNPANGSNQTNVNGHNVNATLCSQRDLTGSSVESKPPTKKDGFQVKSGIWADSLSRGIIDLNIAAPKKVNLADVGIVGALSDGSNENDRGPSYAFHTGRSINTGPNLGNPGFSSSTSSLDEDFFSSLSSQPYQYGSFKK